MKFKNILLTFLVFFHLVFYSSWAAGINSKVFVLAKVNNQVITNTDLIDRYRFFLSLSKVTIDSESEKHLILNQLLQKMIDEELQINEAANLNLNADDEEINKAAERMTIDQNTTLPQLKKFFNANHISYNNFIKQVRSQLLWSKIISKAVAPKIKINESEIRESLELRKIKSNEQKLLLAEIYIPITNNLNSKNYAKELSEKLVREIRNGKDFKSIAKQFPIGSGEDNGGEIGWMSKNDLDIKVYKAIEKLKINEISDPILIKDGYYIFKILDKKNINTMKDEDINQIKNIIFNQRLEVEAKSYLMELRKSSFIEINKENIKQLI